MLDITHLSFLGFLAPVILFYQQSREIFRKILRILWKTRVLPEGIAAHFYLRLTKVSWILRFDDYDIKRLWLFSLKHNQDFAVFFKVYNFEIAFYKYCIPILIFGSQSGNIKIVYFKYTFNFDKFMDDSIQVYCHHEVNARISSTKSRFYIKFIRGRSLKQRFEGGNSDTPPSSNKSESSPSSSETAILEPWWIFNQKIPNRCFGFSIDQLTWFVPINEKNKYQLTQKGLEILNQVEKWIKAEKWYKERNILWRRSYMLEGKPGNGKSALVLEIGKRCGLPIIGFDLATMDNNEFISCIERLHPESGILLFEDIDVIFNGRDNITKTSQFGGLTFDCFINALSGVNAIKNKIIFFTTNHLEKVDGALLRPGRIDEIVHIEPLNLQEKRQLAAVFFDNQDNLIQKVMEEGEKDSTAEFENRCTKLALECFWQS